MNKIFALLLFLPGLAHASGINRSTYELVWSQPETNLELKTFIAPLTMIKRVGETGEYSEKKKLPILREAIGHKVEMIPGETSVLYLVAKNSGKKPVKFYVAPHHIHPAEATLGFSFRCLCYNHIYTVEAGKLWYRVMLLKTEKETLAESVKLKHTLILKK